jgi:hypothetical protein
MDDQCGFNTHRVCKKYSMISLRTKILPRFSAFDRSNVVSSSKRYLHKWPQNSPFLPALPAKQAKTAVASFIPTCYHLFNTPKTTHNVPTNQILHVSRTAQ